MTLKTTNNYLPYMKAYEKITNIWSPYIMFKQRNLIKNNVVNTDKFGFRYTDDSGRYTILDDIKNKKNIDQIAVIGNSTAFGVGASSDKKTIASLLCKKDKTKAYNLSLRTCNSFQELILFQQVMSKFEKLKTIIIISGFNDLLIDKYVEHKTLLNPPVFFQNRINSIDIDSNTSILKKIIKIFSNKNSFKTRAKLEIDKNFDWKKNFSKNIKIWSSIGKEFNFNIIYALQPYYKWSKKNFSNEEKDIFDELEKSVEKTYKVLKDFNQDDFFKTQEFFNLTCNKNNVKFIDLNMALKEYDDPKNWLFVDALHLTDLGYKIISDKIKNFLD